MRVDASARPRPRRGAVHVAVSGSSLTFRPAPRSPSIQQVARLRAAGPRRPDRGQLDGGPLGPTLSFEPRARCLVGVLPRFAHAPPPPRLARAGGPRHLGARRLASQQCDPSRTPSRPSATAPRPATASCRPAIGRARPRSAPSRPERDPPPRHRATASRAPWRRPAHDAIAQRPAPHDMPQNHADRVARASS